MPVPNHSGPALPVPAVTTTSRGRVVTASLVVCGLFMLVNGVWAFISPRSFEEAVGFGGLEHFVRDAGAFQVGIGAALLLALVWADSRRVVLAGFVVGSVLHLASHGMEPLAGSNLIEIAVLALATLLGLVGIAASRGGRA